MPRADELLGSLRGTSKRPQPMGALQRIRPPPSSVLGQAEALPGQFELQGEPGSEKRLWTEIRQDLPRLTHPPRPTERRLPTPLECPGTLLNHGFILIPEPYVRLTQPRTDRAKTLHRGFRRHPCTGGGLRQPELHSHGGVRVAACPELRPDLGSTAGPFDRGRDVSRLRPIGSKLDRSLAGPLAGQLYPGLPPPRAPLEQLDSREALGMHPREVLPVEDVLPDARQRAPHDAVVAGCAHPRAASSPLWV